MGTGRISIILPLLIALCSPALAADRVEVEAAVDRDDVVIGGRVRLEVTARNVRGMDVSFPERPERLGDFSFIGSRAAKSGWIGRGTAGMTYVLGIYTTGTHVIPPVKVRYKPPDAADWSTLETRQIPVNVRSLLTDAEADIRDIKGLAGFRRRGLLIFFTVMSLIFAAALAGWALWRRKRKSSPAEAAGPVPAHVTAYEELSGLKSMDLPGQGKVKEYYIRLSEIVRHYIESRFSYRAPEMTTEEFLNYVNQARELKREHKDLLRKFLTHCDMVKFAKYGPTSLEILDSFGLAEDFVDQTKLDREDPHRAEGPW